MNAGRETVDGVAKQNIEHGDAACGGYRSAVTMLKADGCHLRWAFISGAGLRMI